MLKCKVCKLSKPAGSFYSRPDRKSKYQSYCKDCFNTYCMERWKQKKLDAIQHMGGKCFDCQISYHPNIYEFHHLNDKKYTWTKLRLKSWINIKKELAKCVMLCANCHRMRHALSC